MKSIRLVLMAVPLAVAAPLLWRIETRMYGVIVLATFVALLPAMFLSFGFAAQWDGEDHSWRVRARAYAIGTLIGALVAVNGLGLLGALQREGSFAVVYGDLVTVHLPDRCFASRDEVSCHGARWKVGDEWYTGSVHLAPGELGAHMSIDRGSMGQLVFSKTRIEAFVYPGFHDAYTAKHHTSDVDGMEAFGLLPWWTALLVPGAIAALLAFPAFYAAKDAIQKRRKPPAPPELRGGHLGNEAPGA